MHHLIERIYELSPHFIKDVMTSVYGYVLYKQRYQGRFEEYIQEQIGYLSQPLENLINLQNERLQKIIRHAYENVPYYKDLFDRLKLKPGDIKNAEDLSKIPILEKDIIRKSPNSLVARNIDKREIVLQYTSGTTGTPLELYNTLDGLQYSHALEFFVRYIYGLTLKSKQASFIGRIVVPYSQTNPPFWHYNLILNQYLFSSYHMSDQYLLYYIDKLEDFHPDEIVGYPSSIYILAKFLVKNNIKSIRPKVVFGNSEPILAYQREVMEEAFHCPVREWYSSTEQAFFAYQCPYENYHIVHPYGIVEIVDSKDNDLNYDEIGDLVCTGLTNYAMPLIRYRIGDSASIGIVDCPCSNKSMVFKEILGRSDDILVTPDGKHIGRLDPVFKGLKGIKECQIIQKDIDKILLKIVKEESYSEKDTEILIASLVKRIGTTMKIQVEYTNEIPRGYNGKFRAVVSEIR